MIMLPLIVTDHARPIVAAICMLAAQSTTSGNRSFAETCPYHRSIVDKRRSRNNWSCEQLDFQYSQLADRRSGAECSPNH
jgi:hypothetical protein